MSTAVAFQPHPPDGQPQGREPPGPLLVLSALGIEAAAARAGLRRSRGHAERTPTRVVRTGMGATRAAATARRLAPAGADPSAGATTAAAVAVVGVAGALVPALQAGDLVVADRVLDSAGRVVAELPSAGLLAAALRRTGRRVTVGPVVSVDRPVSGLDARRALARTGAVAVDMESAAVAGAGWTVPLAVVRAISDTSASRLWSPGTVVHGVAALRALRSAMPAIRTWAAAAGPHQIVLAGPRSFCAGVERAIDTVRVAIQRFGAPVYVRRQIVHNRHVVAELEGLGAIFVRELDEVPDGATVVFSAHGVGTEVRAEAERRHLHVIDATCPLVAKVHTEVRRHADRGYEVVLIGHPGHDETEGTLGEIPGIHLVESPADVAALPIGPDARVAYATQTTLSPEDVAPSVAALTQRFGQLAGPRSSDICYATHNRQQAVAALAPDVDLVLVVGSATSSNSQRLVEVARRSGAPDARLVDDENDLRLDWLVGTRRIGLTAGASAPETLVQQVVEAFSGLGPVAVDDVAQRHETVSFSLPLEVR